MPASMSITMCIIRVYMVIKNQRNIIPLLKKTTPCGHSHESILYF